jgi:hypothetical protein
MVEQNRNFGDVDRLAAKVVEVVAQQFNQTLIVGHTCFGAVCEEWQAERIDGQMSLDGISALVMAEPLDSTLALQVFFTACESMMSKRVHLGDLLPHLPSNVAMIV